MFYRIKIDLAFTNDDSPFDILEKALDVIDQAIVINPDQDNEERGYVTLEKCYHDEDPTKPCEVIKKWQVED